VDRRSFIGADSRGNEYLNYGKCRNRWDTKSRFLDDILIETGKLVQSTKLALSSKQQPEKSELEIVSLGGTKESSRDGKSLLLADK
jgi:hypothetical protein